MNEHDFYDPNAEVDMSYVDQYAVNAYVAKVFGWMFLGLLITALTTAAIVVGIDVSYAFRTFIYMAMDSLLIVVLIQFGLVFFMSARVHRMNPGTAKLLYVIYAMINGLSFGFIVFLFGAYVVGMETVVVAFGISAVSFGIMAVYGLTTKNDLTHFGSLLFMGLIGIIIAGFVNWFLGSAMFEFIILVGGLAIFLGIVAVKTERIKNHYAQVVLHGDNPDGSLTEEQEAFASNLAIHGALTLYLTFINIFIRVLMLLARSRGGRRR